MCAFACFLGRVGRAGLPGAFWCAQCFAVAILGALFPFCATLVSGISCFPALGALGPRVLCPPPSLVFVFSFSPPLRPCCFRSSVFSGPGCLGPWRLVPPPPSLVFLSFFAPLVSGVSCFPALVDLGFGVLCPPSRVFFLMCRGVPLVRCCGCVSWALGRVGVCCWGPCASAGACVRLRSVVRYPLPVPLPFVLLPVVLRVPAGAVLAALLSPVLPLVFAGCAPPPPDGCGVLCCASSCFVSCGAAGCGTFCVVPAGVWGACVGLGSCAVWLGALLCRAVLCCFCPALLSCAAALSAGSFFLFWLFLAFPWCSGLFLFLCSACAVLCWCACVVALCTVLSCPCAVCWCFVLLPVVSACLLLGLAVLCCLLVGPGGSWCRDLVVCCGVSLGAVLRRVAARCADWRCVAVRCVVSFCSVWYCRALCHVLWRCPTSWGPVPSGAVFCLVSPRCVCFAVVCCCVVLFAVVLCAMCVLGCRALRSQSSPSCAVLLCGPPSLGALLSCAVHRGAVLPRGAVVSCPAALLGLFLAFVWFHLLEKPLQNLLKYFFSF